MRSKMTARTIFLACALTAGCAEGPPADELGSLDTEDEAIAEASAELKKADTVRPWGLENKSTVWVVNSGQGVGCTGTIIGPHHVLTAAHCDPGPGGFVGFYPNTSGPMVDFRGITHAYAAWGVDVMKWQKERNDFNQDVGLYDSNGKFADFVVLTLSSDIPSDARPALLPIYYLGNGEGSKGIMVGLGKHDGVVPNGSSMRYLLSKVFSSNNGDGHFLVDSSDVDPGDSGGPYYTYDGGAGRLVVHGALSGVRAEWTNARAKYTSVDFHLNKILAAMGHEWVYDWNFYGADYSWYWVDGPHSCAVACMQDSKCAAYTQVPEWKWPALLGGTCWLKTSVGGGGFAQKGLYSGRKRHTGKCPSVSGGFCRL